MARFSDDEILTLFQTRRSGFIRLGTRQTEWNYEKIDLYHEYFARFLAINGNEINDVVFPDLKNDFFSQSKLSWVEGKLVFKNCFFMAGVSFSELKINSLEFDNCTFEGSLSFNNCKINTLNVEHCICSESLSIMSSSILNNLILDYNKFYKSISFEKTYFLQKFTLTNTHIGTSCSFVKTKFSAEEESLITDIRDLELDKFSYEWYAKIRGYEQLFLETKEIKNRNHQFALPIFSINRQEFLEFIKTLKFSNVKEHNELIEKVEYYQNPQFKIDKPSISFVDCIIINPVTIHFLNLENFSFENTNIEEIVFSDCDWNIKNRLILPNEGQTFKIEKQYRQLKRIFHKEQDWEMSGLAYISEMKMRKRRLGYEIDDDRKHIFRFILRYFSKKAIEYAVYSIYGFLAGYTQNFARPLSLFLLSTFLIFPSIYLMIDFINYEVWSFEESFQKSLASSLPLIKTKYINEFWWLQTTQIIFSSILLTFIVLGLRKRFKQ